MPLEPYKYNYYLGVTVWHFTLVIRTHEISKECYVTHMHRQNYDPITYSYSTQALFCGGLFKPCKPNTCNDHPSHHQNLFPFHLL